MKMHKAETGTRYGDDSGWDRRVMVDLQTGELEIDLSGARLSAHPRDLEWLIQALIAVRDTVAQ